MKDLRSIVCKHMDKVHKLELYGTRRLHKDTNTFSGSISSIRIGDNRATIYVREKKVEMNLKTLNIKVNGSFNPRDLALACQLFSEMREDLSKFYAMQDKEENMARIENMRKDFEAIANSFRIAPEKRAEFDKSMNRLERMMSDEK